MNSGPLLVQKVGGLTDPMFTVVVCKGINATMRAGKAIETPAMSKESGSYARSPICPLGLHSAS